ncbi:Uncharacterized protein C12orf70-like [Cricetulus griseus]|uniref:Uncharacterized protein C12orf70-like n=1 Tax=Cricetulus griseus TaxID=10029 RepID=G3I0W3_CRIGR|nr:Uncharacterized protein C12orf70-like [Cricetulus griseus]ERE66142.1 hypothetical protein H671_8g19675 [Cricetulus griseus]
MMCKLTASGFLTSQQELRTATHEQTHEGVKLIMKIPDLLRGEIVKMEQTSDRPDEKDEFPENPQTDSLHKVDSEEWDRLEQDSKHSQDPPINQDEQEATLVCADPRVSLSQFSETSTLAPPPEGSALKLRYWDAKMGLQMKELGADHDNWLERINNIIQRINNTESTVKSLLTEVISLENQSESLEDPDEEANIEVDACNEARELKEKLIERIEVRCPKSTSPSRKHALKLFFMFYVVTITGLSCYILFVDATFLFERVLPSVLGHRTMWELREMVAPFLNLEAEDLLPS